MKLTLSAALIGLLAWDYSAAPPGQSAAERFYRAADPAFIRPVGAFLHERLHEMKPVLAEAVRDAGKLLVSYAESENSQRPHSHDATGSAPVRERAAQADATAARHEAKTAAKDQTRVPDVSRTAAAEQASTGTSAVPDDLAPLLVSTNEEPFSGSCAQAVGARPSLINSAITAAGRTTSSSLNYLVHVAILESRLRTYAHAPTSTAAGLFQFTKQTWLAMLKRHGAAHDLGYYAEAIKNSDGGLFVADPRLAAALFGLRQDPTVAAVMAAELAKENAEIMRNALDRAPSDGELYVAHFLGAQDAVKLIRAMATAPSHSSSLLFPDSAKSNPWIFHNSAGKDRSVSDLYDLLTRKPSAAEIALFCKEGYQPLQTAARS